MLDSGGKQIKTEQTYALFVLISIKNSFFNFKENNYLIFKRNSQSEN
jgi:hypothetical protein